MPAWMHARAEHILAKNPSMPKSEAFAIATQQSHALGKTPKSYGTAEGKSVAKEKYDTPGDDKRTANPGKLKSSVMLKTSADLTVAQKAALPRKDFAVSASKSNTGERAYPIPDRRHAASALGFAKMHGDLVDYARVRAKVMAKYPDMLKDKEAEWKDKIHGGLSDKKTPADFNSSSLREGEKVEKEHTSDKHLQKEISMDHLTEDPEYYKKLKKMEAGDKTATLLAFYDELQKIAEAAPETLRSPDTQRTPKPDMSEHPATSIRGGSQMFPTTSGGGGDIKMKSLLHGSAPSGLNVGQFQPKSFTALGLRKKASEEKDSDFVDSLRDAASRVGSVLSQPIAGTPRIFGHGEVQTIKANAKPTGGGASAGFKAFQARSASRPMGAPAR